VITIFFNFTEYIKKSALNAIVRWIKIQFQDFQDNTSLMNCLEAFLNGDILHAGYTVQINKIKQVIEAKIKNY
jgi:hypothetical protein